MQDVFDGWNLEGHRSVEGPFIPLLLPLRSPTSHRGNRDIYRITRSHHQHRDNAVKIAEHKITVMEHRPWLHSHDRNRRQKELSTLPLGEAGREKRKQRPLLIPCCVHRDPALVAERPDEHLHMRLVEQDTAVHDALAVVRLGLCGTRTWGRREPGDRVDHGVSDDIRFRSGP